MRKTLYGALLMIAFSACNSRPTVSEATLRSPEARARGRKLFVEHCALCHGENADGHGRRREGLTGTPANFTSAEWRATVNPEEVFETIRHGKPGTSMPAWRSLEERDIADLTAYVLSVHAEGP
jgi:high-affinity iron transporter